MMFGPLVELTRDSIGGWISPPVEVWRMFCDLLSLIF